MTPAYRTWLIELFAPLGPVSVRRVFGFWGLYLGETMFGLVADERIYLKTDAGRWAAEEPAGAPEPASGVGVLGHSGHRAI